MKVAICDDNKLLSEHFAVTIENLIEQHNLYNFHFCYSAFTNPLQLVAEHQVEPFDVVFLDIEMPNLDGFAVADKLYEVNNSIYILYLTSYSKFAVSSIKHRVYRYILKNEPDELKEGIIQLLKDLSTLNIRFRFTYRDEAYSIPYSSIMCFESKHNKVAIHTIGKTYETVTTLKELQTVLPHNFHRCHSGFIVNVSNIQNIEQNVLLLNSNMQIPLSRKYKQEVIRSFLHYNC